jgi:TrmH family RNA methyltransferase
MLSRQQIKSIVSLQQKKFRKAEKLFIVDGEKLITELLYSDWSIQLICITGQISDELRKLILLKYKGDLYTVSPEDMIRMSTQSTPQGVLAVVHQKENKLLMSGLAGELNLLLDDIKDPGNLGTIIRLADWFGIRNVICSMQTAECFNPKVVQASMGSLFRTNIHYTDLEKLLATNPDTIGLPVYGAVLNGSGLYETDLRNDAFLIFGNEAAGISDKLQRYITSGLTIPGAHRKNSRNPDSLNVAIAAAIFCSEFRRRKGLKP